MTCFKEEDPVHVHLHSGVAWSSKLYFLLRENFLDMGARKTILFGGVLFGSYVDCLNGNKQ